MKVGFVGKGALGLLYGPMAQETLGRENVCFVMDDARYERHRGDVYRVNGQVVELRDVRASEAAAEIAAAGASADAGATEVVPASTEAGADAAEGAGESVAECTGAAADARAGADAAEDVAAGAAPFDALLLAVKAPGLADALEMVRPLVGERTVVIPLLNGVTSERRCAEALGWEHVVGCVSYGMDAARFGTSLEYSLAGELLIGQADDATPMATVRRADEVLTAAGIPHTVVGDLRRRSWAKLIANVGLNQVCAVFEMRYRDLFADETSEAFRTYVGAMREVIAVANAEGVPLTEADMNDYVAVARSLGPDSTPSMAQDRIARRPSEVDEFSGEVIRLADKHGLLVPCNRFLNARVHDYEAAY